MASLDVSEEKFKTEREVVKEERRMRFENQPFGRLPEIIFDKAFTTHPYKHQTIGSMQDLEAASIGDVREFHSTYYVPNNATLVLVGDFDTKRGAARWSSSISARVPRGKPVPRDIPKEPPHTAEAALHGHASRGRCRRSSCRTTSRTTGIPTPIRCTCWRRSCRTATARASIGRSSMRSRSRWRRSARPSSSSIRTSSMPWRSCSRASKPEDVLKELQAQLERVKTEGVTADELNRAKRQFARDYILGRETVQQKALHLAHAVGDSQRHQDGRRRVRSVSERDGGRRPARRARPTSRPNRGCC